MQRVDTGRSGPLAGLRAVVQGLSAVGSLATYVLACLAVWHQRGRERRQLVALDETMLKDLGLDRADVQAECSKPFWRP